MQDLDSSGHGAADDNHAELEPSVGVEWGLGHYFLINSAFGAFFITFIRALTPARDGGSSVVDLGPDGVFATADDIWLSTNGSNQMGIVGLLMLGILTGNCVGFSCLAIGKWLRRRWAHLQPEQRTLLYFLSFGVAGVLGAVLPLLGAGILGREGASILVLCIGFVAAAVSLNVMIFEEMRERLWSYYREVQHKERVERDLRVARMVQTAMFPHQIPTIEGADIAARSIPAKEVGGDYYDFIQFPGQRVLIAVADVAGKGLPAALLMSALRAGLRTLATEDVDLAAITGRLNNLILEASDKFNYITFFVGVYDDASRKLVYVNAGHNPPVLLCADRRIQEEEAGDLVLGVMPDVEYTCHDLQLAPGDLLVIYTDGMIEQHGLGDADFGLERLTSVLEKHRGKGVQSALELTYKAVADFAMASEQYDDQTMVLIAPRQPADAAGEKQPDLSTANA